MVYSYQGNAKVKESTSGSVMLISVIQLLSRDGKHPYKIAFAIAHGEETLSTKYQRLYLPT